RSSRWPTTRPSPACTGDGPRPGEWRAGRSARAAPVHPDRGSVRRPELLRPLRRPGPRRADRQRVPVQRADRPFGRVLPAGPVGEVDRLGARRRVDPERHRRRDAPPLALGYLAIVQEIVATNRQFLLARFRRTALATRFDTHQHPPPLELLPLAER